MPEHLNMITIEKWFRFTHCFFFLLDYFVIT